MEDKTGQLFICKISMLLKMKKDTWIVHRTNILFIVTINLSFKVFIRHISDSHDYYLIFLFVSIIDKEVTILNHIFSSILSIKWFIYLWVLYINKNIIIQLISNNSHVTFKY